MSYNFHEEEYRGCTIKIEQEEFTEHHDPRDWDNVGTMVCWHNRYKLGDEQPSLDPDEYLTSLVPWQVLERFERRENRAYNNRESYYGNKKGRLSAETYYAVMERIESARKKAVEKWIDNNLLILELYLYYHSGITMRTGPFSCPWDSGRVGLIYCTLEKAQHEWGTEDSKAKGWNGEASFTLAEDGSKRTLKQAATLYMEGEVETYDDYLTGQIGCMVAEDPDGDIIDSCGGYFPDHGVPCGKEWDYPISEAKSSIDYWHEEQEKARVEAERAEEKERLEAAHWAARDVKTV